MCVRYTSTIIDAFVWYIQYLKNMLMCETNVYANKEDASVRHIKYLIANEDASVRHIKYLIAKEDASVWHIKYIIAEEDTSVWDVVTSWDRPFEIFSLTKLYVCRTNSPNANVSLYSPPSPL